MKNSFLHVLTSFWHPVDNDYALKNSVETFMFNAIRNGLVFKGDIQEKQLFIDALKNKLKLTLLLQYDDYDFKIMIKKNENGFDSISLYPIAPYKMKKGYGAEKENVDMGFYIERMIELCENFVIYELKSINTE